MFSRGNISEKIRFGKLVQESDIVLDMYAGIGYYTLPAVIKGKAAHVYACEWNEHAANALKFNIRDNHIQDQVTVFVGDCRVSAQSHSLVSIFDRISLGLLPSSEGGWRTAIRGLKDCGGWLHIHANVPISEIKDWVLWTCSQLVSLASEEHRPEDWIALCHHVEKVKSFAPTVAHYVADVYVGSRPMANELLESLELEVKQLFKAGAFLDGSFVPCPESIQPPSCALSDDGVLNQEWMR
jgi:tRNA G37 N-methylase Trm5